MYCLLCIMQSHKMTKLDKVISVLGPEERKILMENCKRMNHVNEKILSIKHEFIFLVFINIIIKIIR